MSNYKAYIGGALRVGFDFDGEGAAVVVTEMTKEASIVLNVFLDAEAELMFQALIDGRGIAPKTIFNKTKFLKTEFGSEMECMITAWDQALENNRQIGEDAEILRTLAWCQAQWEVYRMAIKHFYGVEYHFTRTDEYYGLCTEDESDFLMKVDRELTSCRKLAPDTETDIERVVEAVTHRTQEYLSEQNGEAFY